jgi:excisionase family DNA binding protein
VPNGADFLSWEVGRKLGSCGALAGTDPGVMTPTLMRTRKGVHPYEIASLYVSTTTFQMEGHMTDVTSSDLDSGLISVMKLAELLDCSPKTVRDWLYRDRRQATTDPLPYYRLGGLVRFKLREVHSWIERRRVRVSSIACLKTPR